MLQVPEGSWQTPWRWHASLGAPQTVGVPPQVPLLQWSSVVQPLPSSQVVVSGLGTPPTQRPVLVSHEPACMQAVAPVH